MKFTYSWLKEHLETEHQYNEVVDKLTAIGLEVESVQDTGLAYKDFIVGQVLEEEKHPNADKLKLCKVDIGREKVDVVCGSQCYKRDESCLCTCWIRHSCKSNENKSSQDSWR